mmetsp:Transcript_133220/g.231045  ORF Transcript_133220/g.231045 Transcript_133220/m.231045 type:complete len:429 (-) Transcript_133220:103-1389(-)
MPIDLQYQVGRDEARFLPQGFNEPPLDKFYDVNVKKAPCPVPFFDKLTGRAVPKNLLDAGSTLDYNAHVSREKIKCGAPAHSIPHGPRFTSAPGPGSEQTVQAGYKGSAAAACVDLDDGSPPWQEAAAATKPRWRGIFFGSVSGRESPLVGHEPPIMLNDLSFDINKTWDDTWAPLSKKVPGGRFHRTSSKYLHSMQKTDARAFYLTQDMGNARPKRKTPAVAIGKCSGRNSSHTVTPQSNRQQLQKLLKKVDQRNAANKPPHLVSTATLPSSFNLGRASDFYLQGGRDEMSVQGILPEPQTSVDCTVADVEGQSVRLQDELLAMRKRSIVERKKQNQMNTTELFAYRQSDEYKLKKHYHVYQDKELSKMQEDMAGQDPSKTNIGGSMYKIRFNTEQKELQKAQEAQAAAQEASATTAAGLADDLDEM